VGQITNACLSSSDENIVKIEGGFAVPTTVRPQFASRPEKTATPRLRSGMDKPFDGASAITSSRCWPKRLRGRVSARRRARTVQTWLRGYDDQEIF
jgi:hypothetical protein